MKPEITAAMADKMLAHAIIDSQVFEKTEGGLIVSSALRLKNGYDICSSTFVLPGYMTLDALMAESAMQEELAELKSDAIPDLMVQAKEILMNYTGFQLQRAMMSYYELD